MENKMAEKQSNWEDWFLKKIGIKPLIIAFVVCGALFLLVVGAYVWNFRGGLSSAQDVWGQFGDYVGGVLNPLLSLFTIFGLLLTIFIQRKQVLDSKEQYDKSIIRAEQAESEIRRQRFESTFFELLHTHDAIVNGTRINQFYDSKPTVVEGRECYKIMHDLFFHDQYVGVCCEAFVDNVQKYLTQPSSTFVDKLNICLFGNLGCSSLGITPDVLQANIRASSLSEALKGSLTKSNAPAFYVTIKGAMGFHVASEVFSKSSPSEQLTLLSEAYQRFYTEKGFLIGHYFRSLFHALSYIRDAGQEDEFYSDMLRAQLSSFELVMLFYNCISNLT
jgi:hypothetical protein